MKTVLALGLFLLNLPTCDPSSSLNHSRGAKSDIGSADHCHKKDQQPAPVGLNSFTQDISYFQRGKILVKQGQYEAAAKAYTQGYEAQVRDNEKLNGFKDLEVSYIMGNALAWRDVGDVLTELQCHPQAIQAYQKAIAIDPNYGWFHRRLAVVFEKEQHLSAAADAYEKAGDTMVYYYLSEKIDAYRQSIRLNPKNANAYNGFGEALVSNGDIRAAITAFQASLKLNPHLTEAQDNLEKAQAMPLP